ncbi:hypothetical protein ABIE44_002613 [Marmoricola sp. OAE513]|uniref:NAD(P)H-dependent amine dehydrogenase family protein n=1 Tax=Marmoricola sp. OAE513 TaxID=2817894 RepID=UPI00339673BF
MTERLRIVQWTTGKVARESLRAILERPDLELVGVYAYSADKVGRDVGELAGLGRTIGVMATDDIDALIALAPDCVAYMPLHPEVDHLVRLLRAGINVVSTASFLTGRGYGEEARAALREAALAGGASIFGSGVNPGWADNLAATASSASRDVTLVRMTESFNIGIWAGDANQDALGWGRPAGDPGHAADIEQATLPFGDAVEAIAEMFRITLDEVRCTVAFAHATEDVDIEGRPVQVGQVAGIQTSWQGIVAGRPVIECNVRWTITTDLEPAWPVASAHIVEVFGTPKITLRMEFLPEDMSLPMDELLSTGFIVTAMPVVNAISAVVAARPGIVTYADLPPDHLDAAALGRRAPRDAARGARGRRAGGAGRAERRTSAGGRGLEDRDQGSDRAAGDVAAPRRDRRRPEWRAVRRRDVLPHHRCEARRHEPVVDQPRDQADEAQGALQRLDLGRSDLREGEGRLHGELLLHRLQALTPVVELSRSSSFPGRRARRDAVTSAAAEPPPGSRSQQRRRA